MQHPRAGNARSPYALLAMGEISVWLGSSVFCDKDNSVRAQNEKNAAYRGPVCYHPLLAYCHRDLECADRVLSCAKVLKQHKENAA